MSIHKKPAPDPLEVILRAKSQKAVDERRRLQVLASERHKWERLVDADAKRHKGKPGRMEFIDQLRAAGVRKWKQIFAAVKAQDDTWVMVGNCETTPQNLARTTFSIASTPTSKTS
jgi:hypothetical protein